MPTLGFWLPINEREYWEGEAPIVIGFGGSLTLPSSPEWEI